MKYTRALSRWTASSASNFIPCSRLKSSSPIQYGRCSTRETQPERRKTGTSLTGCAPASSTLVLPSKTLPKDNESRNDKLIAGHRRSVSFLVYYRLDGVSVSFLMSNNRLDQNNPIIVFPYSPDAARPQPEASESLSRKQRTERENAAAPADRRRCRNENRRAG